MRTTAPHACGGGGGAAAASVGEKVGELGLFAAAQKAAKTSASAQAKQATRTNLYDGDAGE